jgi:hypothetical protein
MLARAKSRPRVNRDDVPFKARGDGFPRRQDCELPGNPLWPEKIPPDKAPVLVIDLANCQFGGFDFQKDLLQFAQKELDSVLDVFELFLDRQIRFEGAVPELFGDDSVASEIEEEGT